MLSLDLVELQRPRDGVENTLRRTADLAAFQLGVVVGADPGEHGDFVAAQSGHAALPDGVCKPRPLWRYVGPSRDEEFAHVVFGAHVIPR